MKKTSTYIIAEAGVNHNGSLEQAIELVNIAVAAKADAVKFQVYNAESLVTRQAEKAQYQLKTTAADESQYQMLKRLELSQDDFRKLKVHCRLKKINFLATPFDLSSLDFVINALHNQVVKISSADLTDIGLLIAAARYGCRIILSTGMASLGEIENALSALAFGYCQATGKPSVELMRQAFYSDEGQNLLQQKVTLLHCVSDYPTAIENVNLQVMDTLAQAFQLPVGFSDHSLGINVTLAAVARGACMVEKHFTQDKSQAGPDHQASLSPCELTALVRGIREIDTALGVAIKKQSASELLTRHAGRKSLVAARMIRIGEQFSPQNLTAKRPGKGIPSEVYWDFIGKVAHREYKAGELIEQS